MSAPWPAPSYGPPPLRPDEERTWSILAHVLGLFTGWVGPLIVLLVFKGRGAYTENQAKESLNFQLTLVLAALVVGAAALLTLGFGAVLVLPLVVVQIVFPILGSVAASRFEWYRYPVSLRMVS